MSSDSKEVREVVGILADKISQSTCQLNAQEIGNALYGMQKILCELRYLILALIPKIEVPIDVWSAGQAFMVCKVCR
jgi:hypothetical protein